jgi:hypothetical protein
VKDGAGARVDVMAALLTRVSPPLAHRMKLGPLVASWAIRLVAPVLDFHDASETGRVIRKIGLKLLESILGHDCPLWLRGKCIMAVLAVKG